MMETTRLFIRASRPLFLLGAALVYSLGAGIAHYLGTPVNWNLYLLGQAWVTTLQLAAHYLNEYYDSPLDVENPNRTPFSGGSGAVGPGKLPRTTMMLSSVACLTLTASLTVLLLRDAKPSSATILIMVLSFLGAFFYSVPPIRLAATGYGELTTSILVANFLPAFAILLQTGELHRLVAMSTFPLIVVHLSMMLVFELPDYAVDVKTGKRTLLVRMGWHNGMTLHNSLIVSSYFLLALAVSFGMPFMIALPALLTFPLGLLQIWQMRRLAAGAKPNWTALTLTSVTLFSLMTYLLTYSYWTR